MTRATAVGCGIEIVVLAALLTVALDLWSHKRVEQLGGVNIWGYRGPVLPRKTAADVRIALVGGDFAFGWGQGSGGTIAGALRQLVMLQTDLPGRPLRPVAAFNLGARGLAPAEYGDWIERFAYLRPDVVCLLPDSRAHRPDSDARVPDRGSFVFATFGYAPMLPLALEEKGARLESRALAAVGRALAAADRGLARPFTVSSSPSWPISAADYVAAIGQAIDRALGAGAAVTLVSPLRMASDDAADHQALGALIATRFAGRRVGYVDLGAEPAMYDAALRLNGFDLSSAGVARAAQSIAPSIIEQVRAVIE